MPPKYWVWAEKRASSSQPLRKKIAVPKMSTDEVRKNKRHIGFFETNSVNVPDRQSQGKGRRSSRFGLNCALFRAESRWRFPIMPTYEYSCAKCDQTFEAFQSMREKPF